MSVCMLLKWEDQICAFGEVEDDKLFMLSADEPLILMTEFSKNAAPKLPPALALVACAEMLDELAPRFADESLMGEEGRPTKYKIYEDDDGGTIILIEDPMFAAIYEALPPYFPAASRRN